MALEAELDLSQAYGWYRRMPAMYPVVYEEFRRALIRRFPYAVFYELTHLEITVYAVFQTSRDPEKWRRRLSR